MPEASPRPAPPRAYRGLSHGEGPAAAAPGGRAAPRRGERRGRSRAEPRPALRDVAAGARGPSASGAAAGPARRLPHRRASPPGSKMAAATAAGGAGAAAAALWSEVNRCGQNGDFARALKAVNKSECGHGRRGPPGEERAACGAGAGPLPPPRRSAPAAAGLVRRRCGGEERAGSGSGARAEGARRRCGTVRGFRTVRPGGEARGRRGWESLHRGRRWLLGSPLGAPRAPRSAAAVAGRGSLPGGAGGGVLCPRTGRRGSERPRSGAVWMVWRPKWGCSGRHAVAESSRCAVRREQGLVSCPADLTVEIAWRESHTKNCFSPAFPSLTSSGRKCQYDSDCLSRAIRFFCTRCSFLYVLYAALGFWHSVLCLELKCH